MKHDYTAKEILHAWNHRKYLPGQMVKTLDNLKAFLEALPARPQATEIAALKAERDKLDASLTEVVEAAERAGWNGVENSKHLPTFITTLAEDLSKAQAALRQSTQSAQPILADDGRSLGQVAREAWKKALALNESQEARWMRIAQAVAAAAIAQAVRRMEAVPWRELKYVDYEAVRARLIAAAKGEAQAVVVNEPPQDERQPDLSGESEKQDPYARLKAYAKAGARIKCGGGDWRADEIWVWDYPVDRYEVHPDDLHMVPEYAPQAEPATFEAHGKTWTRHTPGDPMPCDREANVCVTFRDGDYSKPGLAKYWSWDKSLSDDEWIIGWRYADEPAQAEPCVCGSPTTTGTVHRSDGPCYQEPAQSTTSPSWTPAVGDTVRLKSGGPSMTVAYKERKSIACNWIDSSGQCRANWFPAACLTPAPNP